MVYVHIDNTRDLGVRNTFMSGHRPNDYIEFAGLDSVRDFRDLFSGQYVTQSFQEEVASVMKKRIVEECQGAILSSGLEIFHSLRPLKVALKNL